LLPQALFIFVKPLVILDVWKVLSTTFPFLAFHKDSVDFSWNIFL
jgi:hypothetical protein